MSRDNRFFFKLCHSVLVIVTPAAEPAPTLFFLKTWSTMPREKDSTVYETFHLRKIMQLRNSEIHTCSQMCAVVTLLLLHIFSRQSVE